MRVKLTMLKRVFPADNWGRGIPGAGHDELIVGADAAVGVLFAVEDPGAVGRRLHAGLSNVEGVEIQPQLADVRVCLEYQIK